MAVLGHHTRPLWKSASVDRVSVGKKVLYLSVTPQSLPSELRATHRLNSFSTKYLNKTHILACIRILT